ncbi:MAG: DNA-protecting protein DprA [Deltaproteobacteria bacterium]|nr:DNA-protecting protein DprA [Deltaproteobacteria bacterium]
MSALTAWVALQRALFAKPLAAHALLNRFGSPDAIFHGPRAILAVTDPEWEAVDQLRKATDWAAVDNTITWCTDHQVRIIPLDAAEYPQLLRSCPDCPPILFIAGQIEALSGSALVGVVGARKASSYGRGICEKIAGGLAAAGVAVVSGLALGIDGVAHRASLAADGRTVGVLGGGHDRFYPKEHRHLAEQICRNGAVITEFPPDARAHPSQFPQRNRIISGLSMAVVVVEAAERSGSLITARLAAEQGRLVFAVPGPAGHLATRGTHGLLKQGAHIAESAEDVLQAIAPMVETADPGWSQSGAWGGGAAHSRSECGGERGEAPPRVRRPPPSLSGATDIGHFTQRGEDAMGGGLWELLAEPQLLDVLMARTGRAAPELLAWLTQMECAGRVRALPGNRYVKRGA